MLLVLIVEALPDCQYESRRSLVDVVVTSYSYRCRLKLLVRLCYTHSRAVLGFHVLRVHHGHLPLGSSSACLGLWLHLLLALMAWLWTLWYLGNAGGTYIYRQIGVCMSHFVEVTSLLSDASG